MNKNCSEKGKTLDQKAVSKVSVIKIAITLYIFLFIIKKRKNAYHKTKKQMSKQFRTIIFNLFSQNSGMPLYESIYTQFLCQLVAKKRERQTHIRSSHR